MKTNSAFSIQQQEILKVLENSNFELNEETLAEQNTDQYSK